MSAAGDVIGPYRLLEPIGRGAMGEVWRARDERLDRLVAVKLLPPHVADDPERRARMLREAKAAAAVPHGNVVTLFDIVQDEGRDVLVMELVEGHTVADLLRRDGPPPLERGLGWLIGVADALRTAHARGILHRDIKAANVMVTKDGQVKVLDFGLARLADSPTAVVVAGSPRVPTDASLADTMAEQPTTASREEIALDETVASEPGAMTKPGSASGSGSGRGTASGSGSEYATRAGTLLGTPMYMAPEQIAGDPPDERTEVFSLGVLAHEIVAGKPPFKARTVDELFVEISKGDAPKLEEPVPPQVSALVAKAMAHDRTARTPSMAVLHGALVATRDELFGKKVSRWPLYAASALVLSLFVAAGVWWWQQPPPARPGDAYVTRALDEYDVFYGDKALSSLRAALRVDPTHPRALAYIVLFGGTDADRADAVTRARGLVDKTHGKDQKLLRAVIALDERGPAAAREALLGAGADHELAFWAAEMAFRAGAYDLALPAYRDLYQANAKRFRGRIFDHYSGVLLLADEPATAVEVGRRYHDAYPGEADAVGVHATTLAMAGELDQALALAEEAASLSRGEDTLAGLAKVRALRHEIPQARQLYADSLAMAPPARKPLRRAALGLLAWMEGDQAAADAAVAPCLPGGTDASIHTRSACLFVAGVIAPKNDPRIDVAIGELVALAAAATPTRPAYGAPASLASILRARKQFTGEGCLKPRPPPVWPLDGPDIERNLAGPIDFYVAYHVPFFSTWAICERAWLAYTLSERDRAIDLLRRVATRAPGRWWLDDSLTQMQK